MIVTDCHLHCAFSGDSEAPMEDMVRRGIALGLKTMCFTDHLDVDYPDEDDDICFDLDTASYYKEFQRIKALYEGRIELLFGVEFGLQEHLVSYFADYQKAWPFDFIIGSSHLLDGFDPYYQHHMEGRTDAEIYGGYFDAILSNLRAFDGFQVYGHLDYIVRYGHGGAASYHCSDYVDVIDEILRTAIEKGIGIELNTSGLKYGLGFAHPHPDILKRYRELGGEILTIGSDAHKPEHIAWNFDVVPDLLKACGFRYYSLFRGRKPDFIPL